MTKNTSDYEDSTKPLQHENQSQVTQSNDFNDISYQHALYQHSPEVALFRGVILQAVLDSRNHSKRTEDTVAKRNAIKWFNVESKDFLIVCDYAEREPNNTVKEFAKSLFRRLTLELNGWKASSPYSDCKHLKERK